MPSAVGIRMDTEKKSLLPTTLSLQERLKESQAAILLEKEKAEMATKEADTGKGAGFNKVDITIVPYGHVPWSTVLIFCFSMSIRLQVGVLSGRVVGLSD